MVRPPLRLLVVIGFVFLLGLIGVYFVKKEKNQSHVLTTGIVEAEEVGLSSEIPARILSIKFKEGESVQKGDILVILEAKEIEASLRQAEAAYQRAVADVDAQLSTLESIKSEIKTAEADVQTIKAEIEASLARQREAKRQYDRAESLYKEDMLSKAEVDLKATALETAGSELNALKARLQGAESRIDSLRAKLKTQMSLIESAKAKRKEAEADILRQKAVLEKTIIKSPITGVVLFGHLKEGEIATPSVAILTIANLDNLWVRVDIDETQIGALRLGDKVAINAWDKRFDSEVIEIGRYAEFATQRDVIRGRHDIKTFRVKLRVHDPERALKPGMTVLAEIPKR